MPATTPPTSSSDAMVVTAYWLNGSRAIGMSDGSVVGVAHRFCSGSRIPVVIHGSRHGDGRPGSDRDSDGDLLRAAALFLVHHGTVPTTADRAGVRCQPVGRRTHRPPDLGTRRGAATDSRRAVVR